MARISYVDDQVYQRRLNSPQVANLLRVLYHSPTWADAFVRLAGAQMSVLKLASRDRELVILVTGHLLAADYVVAQHEGIARMVGISIEQQDALRSCDFEHASLGDRDRALARFVTMLVTRSGEVSEAMSAAARFYSEAELVEIVGVQGFAATVAAITKTFDVEVDPVSGDDLLRFSKAVGT